MTEPSPNARVNEAIRRLAGRDTEPPEPEEQPPPAASWGAADGGARGHGPPPPPSSAEVMNELIRQRRTR
jgi:hypothetical protein